jgi:CRP-like cAMP-binding protein
MAVQVLPFDSPQLDALLAGAPTRDLDAGDAIGPHQIGDACLLVIESGVALVRAAQPQAFREVVVCHAGPGSLVLPPRDMEVLAALVPTRVVLLSPELRDCLLEIPGAPALLFDALAATVRQKHRTIEALARHHHLDRVRAKLLQLAADHGVVGRDGIRLDLPLTHELLGEMTGSARETVTRAIDELRNEGMIVRRGRAYVLLVDPDGLPA